MPKPYRNSRKKLNTQNRQTCLFYKLRAFLLSLSIESLIFQYSLDILLDMRLRSVAEQDYVGNPGLRAIAWSSMIFSEVAR